MHTLNIRLYNVTIASGAMQKQHRMLRPEAEAEGDKIPTPIAFGPGKFLIGIYDPNEEHETKVAALRAVILEELNLPDGVTIEPVPVPYTYPQAWTPDIWLLQPGHLKP